MTQDRDSGNALAERRRRALHSHFAVTQGGDRRPGRRGVGVAGSIVSSDLQPIQRCGCQAACCPCRSHIGGQAASGARACADQMGGQANWSTHTDGLVHSMLGKKSCTSFHIPEHPRTSPKINEKQRRSTKSNEDSCTSLHERGTAVSDAQAIVQMGLTSLYKLLSHPLGQASGRPGRVSPRN